MTKFLFLAIAAAALTHPVSANEQTAAPFIPVEGNVEFAVQCPDEADAKPAKLPLSLWNAAVPLKKLELAQTLESLVFMADCRSGVINVQSTDGTIQSTVALGSDGSYEMSLGSGFAYIKDDGAGNKDCIASYTTDVYGKVNCDAKDAPVIRAEAVWNLGVGRHPGRDQPNAVECRLPAKAFLYTGADMNQCR